MTEDPLDRKRDLTMEAEMRGGVANPRSLRMDSSCQRLGERPGTDARASRSNSLQHLGVGLVLFRPRGWSCCSPALSPQTTVLSAAERTSVIGLRASLTQGNLISANHLSKEPTGEIKKVTCTGARG